MSKPDPATPPESDAVELPAELDRELLDYLIERAWREMVGRLAGEPQNQNRPKKRAA